MPRIGIYVPAKNTAKYIGDAIRSVLAQEMDDWTMVVLDDASDDGTFEAAKQVADSRCLIVRNEFSCGLIGKLKNQAMRLLPENEFVCHVGSDDLIVPECLSSYVDFMDKHKDKEVGR